MTWATVPQEARRMRFTELYERRQRRELTMAKATELLGMTERTFRRWSERSDTEGAARLSDRRLGRASAQAVPVDEALRMVTLFETRYTGLEGQAFPRAWATGAWWDAFLYVDEEEPAGGLAGDPGTPARRPSQETAAQTTALDDAPSGRLDA